MERAGSAEEENIRRREQVRHEMRSHSQRRRFRMSHVSGAHNAQLWTLLRELGPNAVAAVDHMRIPRFR